MGRTSEPEEIEGLEQASPLRSFGITKRRDTLSDRISKHNKATSFEYISLSSPDGRRKIEILRRIAAYFQQVQHVELPYTSIPVFSLRERTTKLNIGNHIIRRHLKSDFVTIYEIQIVFRPTIGVFDACSDVEVLVTDERFHIGNQEKRVVKFNSNVTAGMYLSLDYSVHVSDLAHQYIVVRNPMSSLRDGVVWGSLRIQMSLKQSAEAVQTGIVPVVAVVEMSKSAMSNHKHNPHHVDISMTDAVLEEARRLVRTKQIKNQGVEGGLQDQEDFVGSEAGSEGEGPKLDTPFDKWQQDQNELAEEKRQEDLRMAALEEQRQVNSKRPKSPPPAKAGEVEEVARSVSSNAQEEDDRLSTNDEVLMWPESRRPYDTDSLQDDRPHLAPAVQDVDVEIIGSISGPSPTAVSPPRPTNAVASSSSGILKTSPGPSKKTSRMVSFMHQAASPY